MMVALIALSAWVMDRNKHCNLIAVYEHLTQR